MSFSKYWPKANPAIVMILLLTLLVIRVGGAVSHYCFDGLEPSVTVHFDNLNGHIEHQDELAHNDIERMVLSDNLLSSVFELDSLLILCAFLMLGLLYFPFKPSSIPIFGIHFQNLKTLLPPLRAPPAFN